MATSVSMFWRHIHEPANAGSSINWLLSLHMSVHNHPSLPVQVSLYILCFQGFRQVSHHSLACVATLAERLVSGNPFPEFLKAIVALIARLRIFSPVSNRNFTFLVKSASNANMGSLFLEFHLSREHNFRVVLEVMCTSALINRAN